MFLLRSFELSAFYVDAAGCIAIDMASDLDSRRVNQFNLYVYHLLSYSDYLEDYENVLAVPAHFPSDLLLPEDLAPAGEDLVLRGHMAPE
jgi:hypothetical protein